MNRTNRIARNSLLVAAAAAAAGLSQQALAASASDFQVYSYYHADWGGGLSVALPGQLYVPADYNPAQSYPLVVFLHGKGEAGTNNTSQINYYIDNLLAAAKSRKFLLYAPQSENIYACWQPTSNSVEADDVDMAMRQVKAITTQYNVNASKMYVTGLSYGGAGAWQVIGTQRDVFAAAVPMVAAGPYNPMSWLAGKPIWSYEAADDQFREAGRTAVNALNAVNGVPAINFTKSDTLLYNGSSYYTNPADLYYAGNGSNQRYTEYQSGGHSNATWGRALGEAPMYDWLLSQSVQPHPLKAGETTRVDFGPTYTTVANGAGITTDSAGRTWNSDVKGLDYKTVGITVPFCMNTASIRTPVTVSVVTAFQADQQRSSTVATLYDATVTQDSWVSSAGHLGQLRVSGLTPGGLYNVMLFASDTDSDGVYGRMTRYTIQDAGGAQSRNLDIVNNVSTEATFLAITADAGGSFLLTVAPTGTARYGELSALTITAVPEPAMALAGLGIPLAAGLLGRRRR